MRRQRFRSRERGNAMVLSLILVFFLVALSAAQFTVVQKNLQQSVFLGTVDELRACADSGAQLGIHDLSFAITGYDGKIGTTGWTSLDDLGADGVPATGDKGEGDGLPTPGEPNLSPRSIGATALGIQLIVYSADTSYANVKRIVATAFSGDASATVEAYAKTTVVSLPRVGAVYIEPDVVLDLNGNSFTIDGRDTNPDGSDGPGPDTFGIATSQGSPQGQNAADIVGQIPSNRQDQILGTGTTPSVGESTTDVDLDALFAALQARQSNALAAGNYSNTTIGSTSAPEVTYVNGDLHVSGQGTGAGVLLIDGNLTMSGQFTFVGIVIVRGDVRQTGGGSGVHVFGSLMVSQSISVVDDPDLTVGGQADIVYSSTSIAQMENLLSSTGGYTVVYWNYTD